MTVVKRHDDEKIDGHVMNDKPPSQPSMKNEKKDIENRAQNLVWQYEHRFPQPSANLVLWQTPQVGASSRWTVEPAATVACRITVSL
ncbi:hypothetical protein EYF80_024378 [Liparis tanakae]|uniref:Uncharacterized protein n=1 Tax=Liparis tanakae TaxID=230148 RepID=A0A4Z2HHX5_9TELE|nr:hypothetical protein EYF80_024378 [Liparis tanakae]